MTGMVGGQADYARHAGISRQAVHKMVAAGKIPVRSDGQIDFVEADVARDAIADPARRLNDEAPAPPPPAPAAEGGLTFNKARTATEAYRARLAEIEYKRAVGALLPREGVERGMFAAGRVIKRQIDTLVSMAEEIAAAARDGGADQVRALLRQRVREVEQAMSDALTAELNKEIGEASDGGAGE